MTTRSSQTSKESLPSQSKETQLNSTLFDDILICATAINICSKGTHAYSMKCQT